MARTSTREKSQETEVSRLRQYVADLRDALRSVGARSLYFPMDKELRIAGNLRLAREFGYGLRGFATIGVKADMGGYYGMLIVANSLDSIGVCVNARQFLDEMLNVMIWKGLRRKDSVHLRYDLQSMR